jgi:hypothetical protein
MKHDRTIMKTKSTPRPKKLVAEPAIRSVRWIAKDSTGRELVVYNRAEEVARKMLDSSKLLQGEYTVRRAGHIDDQGRLHIDDAPPDVIDRRITS